LQEERGISAFGTGVYSLPLGVLLMICAPISGRVVGSRGPRVSFLGAGASFLISAALLTNLGAHTALWVLIVSYLAFGAGLGMVNPAITNNAVAGMPLTQAGVAAATASASRQVGAALGVAIAGTVVNVKALHHNSDFAAATHAIWWGMVGCSVVILLLGWMSTTSSARATASSLSAVGAD
jgi:MFS family permease